MTKRTKTEKQKHSGLVDIRLTDGDLALVNSQIRVNHEPGTGHQAICPYDADLTAGGCHFASTVRQVVARSRRIVIPERRRSSGNDLKASDS
jgi:hypothetical protein